MKSPRLNPCRDENLSCRRLLLVTISGGLVFASRTTDPLGPSRARLGVFAGSTGTEVRTAGTAVTSMKHLERLKEHRPVLRDTALDVKYMHQP